MFTVVSCQAQTQTKDTTVKIVDSISLIKKCLPTTEKWKGKTVFLTSRESKFVIIKSRKGIWYRRYLSKANPK